MKTLFAAPDVMWDEWSQALRRACPEMQLHQKGAPESFDAIIYAPGGEIEDLSPYTNARLVQSLWAGVEKVVANPTLTQPLARMVDPGLARGMAEFCTGWVMRAHLQMDHYAQDGVWRNGQIPPLATERNVTILGLGELGSAVARMLIPIGFKLTGYSVSGRPFDGAEVVTDLNKALERAEIVVTLLPDTPATRGLLNAENLARLPKGAWIINAGRGSLIDEAALIKALDTGQIGHAVLDVFQTEPLPEMHPFWQHSGVTVTPHIAAETRPETAAPVVAENLRRVMAGQMPLYLVDKKKGY